MVLNPNDPKRTAELDRCYRANNPIFILLDAVDAGAGNLPATPQGVGEFVADQNYFLETAMLNLSLNIDEPNGFGGSGLNSFKMSLARNYGDGVDWLGFQPQPAYKDIFASLQLMSTPKLEKSGGTGRAYSGDSIAQFFDFKPRGLYLNKGESLKLFVSGTAPFNWTYYALAHITAMPTYT